MALSVKTSSGWRNASALVKVAGQWKEVSQLYVKQNGAWKPLWSYGWKEGAWSACSTTCGGGTQSREVTCQRSDGQPAPESLCDAATKPESSQGCNTQACVNYSWYTGAPSSLCSVKCGDGVRNRTVYCRKENTDGTFSAVVDSFCEDEKPSNTEPCFSECKWYELAWGACSGCGEATQQRVVHCLSNGLDNNWGTSNQMCTDEEYISYYGGTVPERTKTCWSCATCSHPGGYSDEAIVRDKAIQLNATRHEGRDDWTIEEARSIILQAAYDTQYGSAIKTWWALVGQGEKVCGFVTSECCDERGFIYHP